VTHVLAHQGGWDELLLVAIPLVLLALLLGVASVRAKRLAAGPADDQTDAETKSES
jgi:hypothetical protein